MQSRKEVEAAISRAIVRFEKEFLGRGPFEVKSYIMDDIVLVRLKGVLTPAEYQIGQGSDSERGRRLVKQMRQQLIESGRSLLEVAMKEILNRDVVSLHTDVSTKTGERVIVFTFGEKLEYAD